MRNRFFLSANWEYLAMFNYNVDPAILEKHIPPGTEIDYFEGKAMVSIVGFLFNNTKVVGLRWPFHQNFEEANLRYYIKRFDGNEWKRGVGFISEIVPKPIVANIANWLYNEHYSYAKMNHEIEFKANNLFVEYGWKKRNQPKNILQINALPKAEDIITGSEAEFIFEHYYGYNKLNTNKTIEYEVNHPRWQIFPVTNYFIDCDIEGLYGKEFVPFISGIEPSSVFLAKGSAVTVKMPSQISFK